LRHWCFGERTAQTWFHKKEHIVLYAAVLVLDELGARMKSNANVVIAKMDASAN
jgi:hypothetical protein